VVALVPLLSLLLLLLLLAALLLLFLLLMSTMARYRLCCRYDAIFPACFLGRLRFRD